MSCRLFFLPLLILCSTPREVTAADEVNSTIGDNSTDLTDWLAGTCSLQLGFCDRISTCEELVVGNETYFRCQCPPGVPGNAYLNGTACGRNVTDCMQDSGCHQYGFCNATDNYCSCREGFLGDGFYNCTDIDECSEAPCDKNADCMNVPGSFVCTCNFTRNYYGDGLTCVHRCSTRFDCHFDALCNTTTQDCYCKDGYRGDGLDCEDIDECAEMSPCFEHSVCVNEQGSYRCQCVNGYFRRNPGDNCTVAPRDCEEIRIQEDPKDNGYFYIDPDFDGPANLFLVRCRFKQNYGLTKLQIINSGKKKKRSLGQKIINYGTDVISIRALLERSYYCSQETMLTCDSDFTHDFRWVDAYNVSHSTWAGATEEGQCACGQLKKCDRCYCDERRNARDKGTFVDKTALPVMEIYYPDEDVGMFTVGELVCGPRTFDLPRDCDHAKQQGLKDNAPMHIDVDGPFDGPPVLVWCDVETYRHVGVTEMPLTEGNDIVPTNSSQVPLDYVQDLPDIDRIITALPFCAQHVAYSCYNSRVTSMKTFVTVTSQRRDLTYFPGANGVTDSCACGATKSCENTDLGCNCDAADATWRTDFGAILDRSDLPLVGVTADVDGAAKQGRFKVSNLLCAPQQFGIEPNCEKLRGRPGFVPVQYTYWIDPDGPAAEGDDTPNSPPFLAECVFVDVPAQGITVIHHPNETEIDLPDLFEPSYLQVNTTQIVALKVRSTYCTQEVTIECTKFTLTSVSGSGIWSGVDGNTYSFDQTLSTCIASSGCQCDGSPGTSSDSGTLDELSALPIVGVDFTQLTSQLSDVSASASITIGPLKCSEVFPSCSSLQNFILSGQGAEGETLPAVGYFAIDPDGAGPIEPFEVSCNFPNTDVETDNPSGTVDNDGTAPVSKCFDITYSDRNGNPISPQQLLSLRDRSDSCFQELMVSCNWARVYGQVNFTTCDGVEQVGWAGSVGQDSCACGVGGFCVGGRNQKCNCDVEDAQTRTDGAVIIRRDRLPVCKICLALDGIPADNPENIPKRKLKYRLSDLICHPGGSKGVENSCQEIRRRVGNIPDERVEVVYMNQQDPTPVGCRLLPDPPIGQLEIFPQDPVHEIPDGNTTEISILYFVININIINTLMTSHVYCYQRVFIFCADNQTVTLGGNYGWFSVTGSLEDSWVEMTDDQISDSGVCSDYPDLCLQCGIPKGFAVHDKFKLPITGLRLPIIGPVWIVVDNARCPDVFSDCYEIMLDGRQRSLRQGNIYVIDPDGAGGVDPFTVNCDFNKNKDCAITRIYADSRYEDGVTVSGEAHSGGFKEDIQYIDTTIHQMETLTQVSAVCWQPVDFECVDTKLINDGNPDSFYTLQNNQSLAFGVGDVDGVIGCACSLTGTCEQGGSCNCDAQTGTLSGDWGVESRKEKLPLTSIAIGGQTLPNAQGTMSVGPLMCANKHCKQFPKDCQQALQWGRAYGMDYTRSGVHMIHPNPDVCDPFFVYCEMDVINDIGVTKIKPKMMVSEATPGQSSNHEYFAPTLEQIQCLIDVSDYCFQPVKYECYKAGFLDQGVVWSGPAGAPVTLWGGGSVSRETCACGAGRMCGGLDSRDAQRHRKCNCDVGDEHLRVDAGVLKVISSLPVIDVDLTQLPASSDSFVNITLGDLYCAQIVIDFDECTTGFHDCNEHAKCVDTTEGYACQCQVGWQGKFAGRTVTDPVANGRECMDDNECSFNPCPYSANCTNTPGSYFCTCKDGYVQTGPKTCVDINECKDGSHQCDRNAICINEDGDYKCVCKRDYRGSGFVGDCLPVGLCTIFGDPHEFSFDKMWLHYQGSSKCVYVASQDGCDGVSEQTFRVLYKPWQQDPPKRGVGRFTWVHWVEVHIKGKVIKLSQNRKMQVNGVRTFGFSAPGLSLLDNGRQAILLTDLGIEVYWDGQEELQIVLPPSYHTKVCGHCGDFNGRSRDDMILGPGCSDTPGVLTTNPEAFGSSWVDPSYHGNHPECTPDCSTEPPEPDCVMPVSVAEDYCNTILEIGTSPFSDCLKLFDDEALDGLYTSCVFDICHVYGDIMATLCFIAQTIVEECQINFAVVVPEWRTPEFCGLDCTGNMTYMICGPDPNNPTRPETTCVQLRSPSDLGAPDLLPGCMEGCFCLPGYVKEGDRCILPEDCGCVYNETYFAVDDLSTDLTCWETVVCRRGGQVEITQLECGGNATCRLEDGVVSCHCDEGFLGDGFVCDPDPCYNVTCNSTRQECVLGQCECKQGYIGDCEKCEDIDECKSQVDDCDGEGEVCVNEEGGYRCDCENGYVRNGDKCEDIDECKQGEGVGCPANSECFNKPGMYACFCCVGYTISTDGLCVLDPLHATQYRDPTSGTGCCSCDAPECDESGKVCGSDGKTYSNMRALIVRSCLEERRVQPMYKGRCKGSCDNVVCDRPFATCREIDGMAVCQCPGCPPIVDATVVPSVCASNMIVYRSECEFQAAMCNADIKDVVILPDISECTGPGGGVPVNSTGWSNCSVACGEGIAYRTLSHRYLVNTTEYVPCENVTDVNVTDVNATDVNCTQAVTVTDYETAEFNATAVCYGTCGTEFDPCMFHTCTGPAQVCVDAPDGPLCVCPKCDTVETDPVCGALVDSVTTFDSECDLRRKACDLGQDFYIVDNVSCEAAPIECGVAQNFYRREDPDGCFNPEPFDYGICSGGCGRLPDECCYKSEVTIRNAPFQCPDSLEMREVEVVTGCACIPPEEVARLRNEEMTR